jgi:hypothetical protein
MVNRLLKTIPLKYKVIWSFPGLKIEASSSVNYRPKLTDNSQVDYSEQKDDLAFSDNFSITYSKPNKTDTSGL